MRATSTVHSMFFAPWMMHTLREWYNGWKAAALAVSFITLTLWTRRVFLCLLSPSRSVPLMIVTIGGYLLVAPYLSTFIAVTCFVTKRRSLIMSIVEVKPATTSWKDYWLWNRRQSYANRRDSIPLILTALTVALLDFLWRQEWLQTFEKLPIRLAKRTTIGTILKQLGVLKENVLRYVKPPRLAKHTIISTILKHPCHKQNVTEFGGTFRQ